MLGGAKEKKAKMKKRATQRKLEKKAKVCPVAM
jgi:hypothetical protein